MNYRGYKKVFDTNKNTLEEMIALRKTGWSLKALALRYGVNETSVRYQCIKNGLPSRIDIVFFLSRESQEKKPESYREFVERSKENKRIAATIEAI